MCGWAVPDDAGRLPHTKQAAAGQPRTLHISASGERLHNRAYNSNHPSTESFRWTALESRGQTVCRQLGCQHALLIALHKKHLDAVWCWWYRKERDGWFPRTGEHSRRRESTPVSCCPIAAWFSESVSVAHGHIDNRCRGLSGFYLRNNQVPAWEMATSSVGESKTYWCGQLPQIHLLPRKYYFHRRAWKRCVCRNLAPRKPRLSGSLLKPKPQSRSLKSGINPDSSKLLHGLWKRVGVSECVEKSVRLLDVPVEFRQWGVKLIL